MLAGSGRDVRTGTDGSAGSAEVLARASLELRIDFHGGRTVRSITSDPVRVDARVEPSTGQIVDIVATPAVLPHVECPQAASSATRLMGSRLPGLRTEVRSTFVGPSTCPHLNNQTPPASSPSPARSSPPTPPTPPT